MKRLFIIAAAAALMVPALTNAAEIKVLSTQATEEAYRELVPQFEKATGHEVTTVFTGTLGAPKRLADGESSRHDYYGRASDRCADKGR